MPTGYPQATIEFLEGLNTREREHVRDSAGECIARLEAALESLRLIREEPDRLALARRARSEFGRADKSLRALQLHYHGLDISREALRRAQP